MKTIIPQSISSVQDVENFISGLIKNNEMFHLDDNAHDIINGNTGENLFTKDEADKVNELMEQAFNICQPWDLKVVDDYVKAGCEE